MNKNNKAQTRIFFAACLAACLICEPSAVMAHRVTVFAWVDGDTIHTTSKFSGKRKVKGGKISVFDPQGNELVTGITDAKGEFSFKVPQKTDLIVEMLAGEGHRGQWRISADEIDSEVIGNESAGAPAADADTGAAGIPLEQTGTAGKTRPGLQSTDAGAKRHLGKDEIQAAVEAALDRKLKPIIAILADAHAGGPTTRDIFGGIGYIFGLMGIGAYCHYRKKIKELP